ncbi:DUF979 domain-containing protein [Erysipelothrix urinaevulpis]|nr:DUF979 domain-containing protein [Erysipelothrix urinaevulpis]
MFLEMWYILIGFLLLATAIIAFKSNKENEEESKNYTAKYISSGFWAILAFLFIVGPYIPHEISGALVLVMGVLSFTKQVNLGPIAQISQSFKDEQSNRIGNLIFLPSVSIAIGAFVFSQILPKLYPEVSASLLGFIAIGISSLIGLITVLLVTRAPIKAVTSEGTRLMRTMGSLAILPQLLGALGAVFTAAGVGSLISVLLGGIIPDGNAFLGVVAYCVGMAIFTMIMGNAFAAFTVITVGIGIPFVFAQGANPIIASALAMTAGFCGTLMTPMGANFNILPATLLETKSEYAVIKFQAPLAMTLLVIHIFLMYFLAFNF